MWDLGGLSLGGEGVRGFGGLELGGFGAEGVWKACHCSRKTVIWRSKQLRGTIACS